ncbi:MAG: hypothetical protein HY564_03300 [Candidatus Jacksonbacteria bacterium]|nr:hypothetical protein [Candidatus Jacksonbacteria bacterium]
MPQQQVETSQKSGEAFETTERQTTVRSLLETTLLVGERKRTIFNSMVDAFGMDKVTLWEYYGKAVQEVPQVTLEQLENAITRIENMKSEQSPKCDRILYYSLSYLMDIDYHPNNQDKQRKKGQFLQYISEASQGMRGQVFNFSKRAHDEFGKYLAATKEVRNQQIPQDINTIVSQVDEQERNQNLFNEIVKVLAIDYEELTSFFARKQTTMQPLDMARFYEFYDEMYLNQAAENWEGALYNAKVAFWDAFNDYKNNEKFAKSDELLIVMDEAAQKLRSTS